MRDEIITLATPKRLGGNTLENRSGGQLENPARIPFGPHTRLTHRCQILETTGESYRIQDVKLRHPKSSSK